MSQLGPAEIQRYKRHLLLREIGAQGQQQLKASRVLLVGAGGLGSPIALYLAAAGVGRLGLADDDEVSLDNLQRQILFETADIGAPKAERGARRLQGLNPEIAVQPHNLRIQTDNAESLFADYDLVIDGSDNFATRYLVNDACYRARKPLISGAVGPFDGQLTTIRAFEKDAEGQPRPSYRCLFPETMSRGEAGNCADTGVIGAAVGVIGALAAMEALKALLEIGDGLIGKLLIYDALAARFETIRYGWDPANPLNGQPEK